MSWILRAEGNLDKQEKARGRNEQGKKTEQLLNNSGELLK